MTRPRLRYRGQAKATRALAALLGLAPLAALLATTTATAADSRHSLSVQGVLRDHGGALQSMPVGLTIGLYTAADAAAPFFNKTIPTVAVDNGFFTVELSDVGLSFDAADVWLGMQVSGDAAEMPRQHLTAVPFAFNAASADALSPACHGCVTGAMVRELPGGKEVSFPKTLLMPNLPPTIVLSAIGSVSVDAPGPGSLMVTAGSGDFQFFNHNAGIANVATCCISQSAGQTGKCDGAMEYRINPDTPASQSPFSYPLGLTRIFPIVNAGPAGATLYCQISEGNNGGCVTPFTLQAVYFPGRY